MSTEATPLPAGWYPNPENAGEVRYFDGTAWTDGVYPAPPAGSAHPAATQTHRGRRRVVAAAAAAVALLAVIGIGAQVINGGSPDTADADVAVASESQEDYSALKAEYLSLLDRLGAATTRVSTDLGNFDEVGLEVSADNWGEVARDGLTLANTASPAFDDAWDRLMTSHITMAGDLSAGNYDIDHTESRAAVQEIRGLLSAAFPE